MYHFEIDKANAKPIYLQIKDRLQTDMDLGRLQPGQKIPSVRDLCEQLDVSRMTVLQAVRELTREGRLITVTGKGTFVGQAVKLEPNLRTVWGFTETFRAQGYRTASQLIHFARIGADAEAAKALEVPVGTTLYHMMRKRLLDDLPVGVETTQLVQSEFPDLETFDWNNESLYAILRERYGFNPVCGRNYIEAAGADEFTARLLSIPKNTPVLATERIACLIDLHPVEFVRGTYRADRLRLKVEMTSENPINLLASKMDRA